MLGHYIIVAVVLSAQGLLTPQTPQVFLPTSQALDVAQQVAQDEGYSISDKKMYYFDLLLTEEGKAVYPGYVTFGFYGNSKPLNNIAINEKTGQVIDPMTCIVFEYRDLKLFQDQMQRTTHTKPLPAKDLMESIGCDSFTVQTEPAKTQKRK